LLSASSPEAFRHGFYDIVQDSHGNEDLGAFALDAITWWQIRHLELPPDIAVMLISCRNLQSQADKRNSALDGFTELMLGSSIDCETRAEECTVRADNDWYLSSRAAVLGYNLADPSSELELARAICSALMECEFVTAAQALTVLLNSLRSTPLEGSEVARQISDFAARGLAYLDGIAGLASDSWLAWEVLLAHAVLSERLGIETHL